jgi:alpha-beta hydrolase superfamily lysophospholipase
MVLDWILNLKDSKKDNDKLRKDRKNLYLTTSDSVQIGAYLVKPSGKMAGHVIYLHGTGTSRECTNTYVSLDNLANEGWCVLVPDYRGFADSKGRFSMAGANLDVLAGFRYLVDELGAEEVALIGHSMGAAVGVEYGRYAKTRRLPRRYYPSKLILVAPFTSLHDACTNFLLWRRATALLPWLKDMLISHCPYDNLDSLRYLNMKKVFLFHGVNDDVVPYEHSCIIRERHRPFIRLMAHDHISIVGDREFWQIVLDKLKMEG